MATPLRLLTSLCAMLLLGATAARAQSPTPPTLEPAFRAILDNFDVAWETRDAKRFVMERFLSLQDGSFISREVGVRARHVGDDVAFVEQELEGDGVRNADGTEQPARRGQMMLVLRRTPEGWRIQHYRYLDIHTSSIRK
jgi:hypothetical protein